MVVPDARERDRVTYNPRLPDPDATPERPIRTNAGSSISKEERQRDIDWVWTPELLADYADRAQAWLDAHSDVSEVPNLGPGICADCACDLDDGIVRIHRRRWLIGRNEFCRDHGRLRRRARRAAA
jgi:hypothetical protein